MEEELVKSACLGDKEAFLELVENYDKKFYTIARSRLDLEEDVKDAIQETLSEALSSLSTIKTASSFNGWITRVLINKCNDINRYRYRMCCSYDELENQIYTSTADEFIQIENDTDLFSMIDFLPYDEQTIVILHYSKGYTYKDISEILNINENTLRVKIKRIKEKICEKYGKELNYDWKN